MTPTILKLQNDLVELGYNPGIVDGQDGPKTRAAVLAFQLEYEDVADDGVAGPHTLARIASALAAKRAQPSPATSMSTPVRCNDETWTAFEKLVDLVTARPVRYGPGRGLWVGDKYSGKFVITHGPGSLGAKSWPNFLGRSYPSFHCSSWTNFAVGWLLRRNDLYTHAGNVPSLFDLLEKSPSVHAQPGASPYRGYGDACTKIAPHGFGARRSGVPNVVDMRELYDRRDSLPSFVVLGQSTRVNGRWRWWHHTVLLAIRDGRMFRIAADGYRDAAKGYSAQPMRRIEITAKNVGSFDACVYRAYGIDTDDGSYGDQSRPIAAVEIEA